MILRIAISALIISATPGFSLDLAGKNFIGNDKSTIQSSYSCAPSLLMFGGKSKLICNDSDVGILTYTLENDRVINVEIHQTSPTLTFKEATSLLQSQCVAEEDNTFFICSDSIEASVVDRGFAVMINLCSKRHC